MNHIILKKWEQLRQSIIQDRDNLDAHSLLKLLLDAFHSGDIKSSRVINEAKVSVDFGKVIGDFVQDGVPTPTSVGTVINSKTGVHIVPANPIQY